MRHNSKATRNAVHPIDIPAITLTLRAKVFVLY